jgi:ATP-dependent helicase YprA (DUF1998 family)
MAINPISYTEGVIRNFLRYQLTAYPFADEHLYAQMRSLLSLDDTRKTPLMRGPYITLSRSFRKGASVQQLVEEGVLHPFMRNLIPASIQNLYGHQEKAIRAIHARKCVLVSTGTGSGKTESFLYPIISRCLELRDQKAPPGLTAVLVYPMNALAEDQLQRLRDLLAGTGVTFGIYVGKTDENSAPAGRNLPPGSTRATYEAARDKARAQGSREVVRPPEELLTRQQMRETPPRILLTNVKQLEYILTRFKDVELFEGALLEYLVFDEAHTFSGAQGAETAVLIRRLRAFCGRSPDETVCVGTSATLVDPRENSSAPRDFASRLFGVDRTALELVSEDYEKDDWGGETVDYVAPDVEIGEILDSVLRAVDIETEDDRINAMWRCWERLTGVGRPASATADALFEELSRHRTVFHLADLIYGKPRELSELTAKLTGRLGRAIKETEVLCWLGLGAAVQKDNRPLLRPVVHTFVRGIDGGLVTFNEAETRPTLWLAAADEAAAHANLPHARLTVTTCNTCGQHYFIHWLKELGQDESGLIGGEAVSTRRYWPALDEAQGGKRVVLVDRLISRDDDDNHDHPGHKIWMCRACGAAHPSEVEACDGCGAGGPLVPLWIMRDHKDYPGFLGRCAACGSAGRRWGSGYREPARPVRAVQVADVHVLAQDMIQRAERKRLLVFCDNRQEAAFQAGWMRDHARRFRLRALMMSELKDGPISIADIVDRLEKRLDSDDSLSLALLPEVWQQHRKAEESKPHQVERRRYLRIQVLRELVTGHRQRQGLEPWGRLQVQYVGLAPDDEFITRYATLAACAPEVMLAGVASLLDYFRRSYLLHDAEEKLFTKYRLEGDPIFQWSYAPNIPGIPQGLRFERTPDNTRERIKQLKGDRETVPSQKAKQWGIPAADVNRFLGDLWAYLTDKTGVLVQVTLQGTKGKQLRGTSGAYQIEADRLRLAPNKGYWRCSTCRRLHSRMTPKSVCMGWRCSGTIEFVEEDPDNYDLTLLDEEFELVKPEEHSAQVPPDRREQIEQRFKGAGQSINTLVCTPTLEMGVDIGSLDAVLMRNVPPLPANYWQRVGRAGRRHRMAVDFTYARGSSHDRVYFDDPLKMLLGSVEPPRFNMRNELMVAKHVHATVITRLNQLAMPGLGLPDDLRQAVTQRLNAAIPSHAASWLFNNTGMVLDQPVDIAGVGELIAQLKPQIADHVSAVFQQRWPEPDSEVVIEEKLGSSIDGFARSLQAIIDATFARLRLAMTQRSRLDGLKNQKGVLNREEEAEYRRWDDLVKRLKGAQKKRRSQAAGVDEFNAMNLLGREGFLPGYGLESGSIMGMALVPTYLRAGGDFDLPRPPSVALREYVPGNRLYANGQQFVARQFMLPPDTIPVPLDVDVAKGSVTQVGPLTSDQSSLTTAGIVAVPISDVFLAHESQISDEEESRFRMASAVYGTHLGQHEGGVAWNWGAQPVHLLKNARFRLVNVGPRSRINAAQSMGFPLCRACGNALSPYSSILAVSRFVADHKERCDHDVQWVGFYADVVAHALILPGCKDSTTAYSTLESLRTAAAQVLEMEEEDLQILVITRPGSDEVDGVLYDPMPGGSGLMDQLCGRFEEVHAQALAVASDCPAQCQRACSDCLFTYRNQFFHEHLDRQVAVAALNEWGSRLEHSHYIPPAGDPKQSAANSVSAGTNPAEEKLRKMLEKAKLPQPELQKRIPAPKPYNETVPDFFWPLDEEEGYGVCLYLDGMSAHLHGKLETQQKDTQIRAFLEDQGHVVFSVTASQLDDRGAMKRLFFRLGNALLDTNAAKAVRDDDTWFEG